MKTSLALALLLITASTLTGQDKATLKRISSLFQTVEENYETWPHHSIRGENLEGGFGFEQHVWRSYDEPPLYRVESQAFDDHGPGLKQFFFEGHKLLFVLDRLESTPMEVNAATTVTEKRLYFAEGSLIRLLMKEGKFAAGKKVDTTGLKNKDIPIEEVQGAGELYGDLEQEARAIMAKIERITADEAPAGSAAYPSGEGWRLIEGSRSRDGQFALAWGIQGQSAYEGDTLEDGSHTAEPDAEGLTNYVVNLRSGLILGKTTGTHFADKSSIMNNTHEAAWSSAGSYFAQICSGKWDTFDAKVYAMNPDGAGFSESADLLVAARKAAFEHLENGDLFKKFDKDAFVLTLHDVQISQRGAKTAVVVEVSGQIPKSEEEGSYFDLTVVFHLVPDENGGAPALQVSGTEQHHD